MWLTSCRAHGSHQVTSTRKELNGTSLTGTGRSACTEQVNGCQQDSIDGEGTFRPQWDRMMEDLISLGAQQLPSSWVISLHSIPSMAHCSTFQSGKAQATRGLSRLALHLPAMTLSVSATAYGGFKGLI